MDYATKVVKVPTVPKKSIDATNYYSCLDRTMVLPSRDRQAKNKSLIIGNKA